MSDTGWRDMIVGDRMATDREFTDRLAESEFSRQQWGLIMTAVEFEIESTADGDTQLVADTSKLSHVMPELDRVAQGTAAMGGGGGGGGGSTSGGLVGSVKSMLGLGGGGGDADRQAAAAALVDEYATALQSRLEESGKWEQVCRRAGQPSPE